MTVLAVPVQNAGKYDTQEFASFQCTRSECLSESNDLAGLGTACKRKGLHTSTVSLPLWWVVGSHGCASLKRSAGGTSQVYGTTRGVCALKPEGCLLVSKGAMMLRPGRPSFPYTAAPVSAADPGLIRCSDLRPESFGTVSPLPPLAVPQCVGAPCTLLALRAWKRSGHLPSYSASQSLRRSSALWRCHIALSTSVANQCMPCAGALL